MFKRFSLIALAVTIVLSGALAVVAQDAQPVVVGPITQAILDRGEVICGVNTSLAGFATLNDAGEYEGFDVEFCRAVAAAILGDANAVTYRPLQAGERQAAIQSGEIDLMSRNTTMTLSREAVWGATFGPVTFYDGQGLMVRTDTGITEIEGLEGASICVQSGTTTELNLADAFSQRGLSYEPQVFADAAATWEGYLSGRCDAFTTDKSGLAAYRATSEDPGSHTILEITLSKEPLAPLSPQSDPQFADIVMWVVYGMIQAEEFGITSANVGDFVGSEIPEIQRFLGQGDNAAGSLYGIPNDFMVAVITQVGNYGEVFERHLGADTPFGLERGLNALWTEGGLQYSPPFR
ncbi:MAG: amino acid ABC transporter substrate-binding protein [Anaerolineae bacterium]|jgi:general L-amino acid transport system substrate-binding protein|uniref:amino acid ABC transporter substrate-binding protein n=1 Tax=Candidatus Flexifilum breve TaxID=3140694 RepID=UPI001AC4F8AE|nr:amino acid ABC transporter substrate-binding protein [Chloroflexota bacterium]MBK9749249.1 amino acid ABC transporter substrate-binding protein [Chloroflexota bacterium]MBN8636086.1 amino acid ABC transporter substrate-binding protein [Anaerolineae bacterium]